MVKGRKNLAKLLGTILVFSNLFFTKPVFAASTDILIQGKDGKSYQYNIDKLCDSFIGDKKLYNDFISKGQATAYYEATTSQYIDINKIIDNFLQDTKNFDINKFTESAPASDGIVVTQTIQTVVQDANGNIVNGEVINFGTSLAKIVKVSQNTPVIGKTAVYVELTGISDPSTYEVTVKGQKAVYQQDTKQFAVILSGNYTESDFSANDIEVNNTQNVIFDVSDIE